MSLLDTTGGGGGGLHEDGEPVSVILDDEETLTVPSDETWVVHLNGTHDSNININGDRVGRLDDNPTPGLEMVIAGGDEIWIDGGASVAQPVHISGWSL